MDLSTEEVLAVILKHLSNEEKEQSIIYWDKKLLDAGDEAKIGKTVTNMPFKGYMAFVDLQPKVNWGHASAYFLIDVKTHDVKIIKDEFPPYLGDYPESFRVIQRYGRKPPHDRYFDVFDD